MKSLLLVSLVLLGGCSKKESAPASPPASKSIADKPGSVPERAADGTSGRAPFGIEFYEPAADVPGPIRGAVAEDDRSDVDRALDAGRKPGEVLGFFKVAPGQRIGELFAGPGYTTELLARIAGTSGRVYAQNTTEVLDKFARKPFTERLARPAMANTVMVERAHETPFSDEAKGLDVVVCVLNYHDYVWQKVDRAKLNAA